MSAPATKLQRSDGTVSLSFKRRGFRTVLDSLYQQGSYQARFPSVDPTQAPEAVLINTSGGLTDGDVLFCNATWHGNTCALVTSQAAERIYRSRQDPAVIKTELRLDTGSNACWLPQETIVFDGGRLQRSTSVEMAADSTLFAAEIVVMGRSAMGEIVRAAYLADRWRIRQDNKLIFADALLFDERFHQDLQSHFARAAVAGGASCFATVVCVDANCEDSLAVMRDILSHSDVIGGASNLGSLIVARILAADSQRIRSVIAAMFSAIQGDGMQLPRVWNC